MLFAHKIMWQLLFTVVAGVWLVSLALIRLPSLIPLWISTTLHPNGEIDKAIKFHVAQLLLAVLVLGVVGVAWPRVLAGFMQSGDLTIRPDGLVQYMGWLGVPDDATWGNEAIEIGFSVSMGTSIFMGLQLWKASDVAWTTLPSLIPWVLLFAVVNAVCEEAIFRVGVLVPLNGHLSHAQLALLSGLLFGLPHYFGTPSGVVGVAMATFMGWLLAYSILETQGVLVAVGIHLVQDIIIFACQFAVGAREHHAGPTTQCAHGAQ